jgi:hypothetical protein
MNSIDPPFTFGIAVTFENLTILPLLGTSSPEVQYDTLDAALGRGTLHITEVSESGSVPEIKVLNRGPQPVLIIDGEELVGAKQNRTVNLSILVPPAANMIVPVTCVEAGRWSATSRSFSSVPRTHFAAGRAAKSSQVSAALQREGVARADQSQVWEEIAHRSERLQVHSKTAAMSDIFERQSSTIESFVRELPLADQQVGAVFLLNGEPRGVDLFDSPHTFRSLMPKLLRGYALDAIDLRSSSPDQSSQREAADLIETRAKDFVRQVLDASRTQFPSPGLGETWRLFAPQLAGGGLTLGGTLVHMSAFRA